MRGQQDKAAGPDGWDGREVSEAIFADTEITFFFNECERLGVQPIAWRSMRQAHLPKDHPAPGQYHLPEDKWRPLNVASAWYRVWSTARARSPSCRSWCDEWWCTEMYGARRKAETHDALLEMLLATEDDEYLSTWDFSLAFDCIHPSLVKGVFESLGFPPLLTDILHDR